MLPSINYTWNISGRIIKIDKPLIMGILNLTTDSFYQNSRTLISEIVKKAEKMLSEGVDIIDVGAVSTRPGAIEVSEEEEQQRLIPAVRILSKEFPELLISVDTYRANISENAIHEGAHIINDISGGDLDARMHDTVAKLKVPYILMHMRGNFQSMHKLSNYANIHVEVAKELAQKVDSCRKKGIADVIVDPGFGFSKNVTQNFELLSGLEHLNILETPILVGISRKSMIWKTLSCTPEEALNGSSVLHTVALLKGAHLLRVHDVKEAVQAITLLKNL